MTHPPRQQRLAGLPPAPSTPPASRICRQPAVDGWRLCRMHAQALLDDLADGGARGVQR